MIFREMTIARSFKIKIEVILQAFLKTPWILG